jgi:hypothetical protein
LRCLLNTLAGTSGFRKVMREGINLEVTGIKAVYETVYEEGINRKEKFWIKPLGMLIFDNQ